MKKSLLVIGVAALALAGCKSGGGEKNTVVAKGNNVAAQGPNWNETVAMSPTGGFVKGNPNAQVKLIEYGALSCPVCKAFSDDSKEKLRTYVERGTVSVEFKPFFVHPQDLPGTLLAACNGPAAFFVIAEKMFENQNEWAYSKELNNDQIAGWMSKGPANAATEMANYLGTVDFVAKYGVSKDKAKACLADKSAIDRYEAQQQGGMKEGVKGTPTFFINGQKVDNVISWADIEPLLVKAGA